MAVKKFLSAVWHFSTIFQIRA